MQRRAHGDDARADAARADRGARRAERATRRSCSCSRTCTGATRRPSTCSRCWRAGAIRARLLIVGTYRPADVAAARHPLKAVEAGARAARPLRGARARRSSASRRVADYLVAPLPGRDVARRARRGCCTQNTDGNPLFLVNLVDDLIARGQLREADGAGRSRVPVEDLALGRARDARADGREAGRPAHARRAGRAGGRQRRGRRVLGRARDRRRHRRARRPSGAATALARRGQFLRALGVAEWPDGTVAGRYGFIHALYRHVLYARVPIGHRVGLHLRDRRRGSSRRTARARGEIAGELAMHFEHGRDFARAARYRRPGGETRAAPARLSRGGRHRRARSSCSPRCRDARSAQRGADAPDAARRRADRDDGWAAPEVAQTYARARELCEHVGVTPQLFPVLLGLGGSTSPRDADRRARGGATLLALAETTRRRGDRRSARTTRRHGVVLRRRVRRRRSRTSSAAARSTTRPSTARPLRPSSRTRYRALVHGPRRVGPVGARPSRPRRGRADARGARDRSAGRPPLLAAQGLARRPRSITVCDGPPPSRSGQSAVSPWRRSMASAPSSCATFHLRLAPPRSGPRGRGHRRDAAWLTRCREIRAEAWFRTIWGGPPRRWQDGTTAAKGWLCWTKRWMPWIARAITTGRRSCIACAGRSPNRSPRPVGLHESIAIARRQNAKLARLRAALDLARLGPAGRRTKRTRSWPKSTAGSAEDIRHRGPPGCARAPRAARAGRCRLNPR